MHCYKIVIIAIKEIYIHIKKETSAMLDSKFISYMSIVHELFESERRTDRNKMQDVNMLRVILKDFKYFLGGPGSGKGTQCNAVCLKTG